MEGGRAHRPPQAILPVQSGAPVAALHRHAPADHVAYYSYQIPLLDGRLRNTAGHERDAALSLGYVGKRFRNDLKASLTYAKSGLLPISQASRNTAGGPGERSAVRAPSGLSRLSRGRRAIYPWADRRSCCHPRWLPARQDSAAPA